MTTTRRPDALINFANAIVMGVLPVPPAARLPMEMTMQGSFLEGRMPLS
jgi:hypothetical protein